MKKVFVLVLILTLVLATNIQTLAATSGNTPVTFAIDDTQISITVPTTMAATVTAATGELTFAETGKLVNGSAFGVHVTSIVATPSGTWKLGEAGGEVDDTIVATVTPNGGAAVALLEDSPEITGAAWNMSATDDVGTDDEITLTFDGTIENVGALTQALTASGATAFTVTFTVAAGVGS